MATEFELHAELRSDVGKGASRRLRRLEDKIPAIIYGGDKAPSNITLLHKDIKKSLENDAFYSHILTIHVDGKKEKALIKDLQRHPYKPRIMHADFQRVSGKDILQRSVHLHFINEDIAVGVKKGGIVAHQIKDIEITCAATNLPEHIDVDLGNLDLDQTIHLSDIILPEGVNLTHPEHDHAVATISLPRGAIEDEAEEAEGTEPEESSE